MNAAQLETADNPTQRRAQLPTAGNLRGGNFQAVEKYRDALRNLPPSGGGGCHVALLSVANFGASAGLAPEAIFRDLRGAVHGERHVSDKELRDAIDKAARERPQSGSRWNPSRADLRACYQKPQGPKLDAGKMLRGIMAKGEGMGEADLWESSPVSIVWEPQRDAVEILENLFQPEDFLFIGARTDGGRENVRTAGEWRDQFAAGANVPELIAPNPMTGATGATKGGKQSFRADSCVAQFRFAVLEFDTTPEPLREAGATVGAWPRASQCQFWAGALAYGWPIAALIDSGGKSLHAWLAVNARDANEWTAQVEGELFARLLVPLGVDRACRNECRLSRMPGHRRAETNRWQRILFLNPSAGRGPQ